jgi:hypothetical protein
VAARAAFGSASQRWRYVQNYADAKSTVVENILARAAPDLSAR